MPKKTKKAAKYKETQTPEEYCRNCRFFDPSYALRSSDIDIAPQRKVGDCYLVEGTIEPDYTCELFEAVGEPKLESVTEDNRTFYVVGFEQASKFSTSPASTIRRANLPASSFLIVGEQEKKSTWHMPFKDGQGRVNVGFLRAAWQLVTTGEFRGNKPSFTISNTVKTKVRRLWAEWQRVREASASLQSGDIKLAENINTIEYIPKEGEPTTNVDPKWQEDYQSCDNPTLCDVLTDPYDTEIHLQTAIESVDAEAKTMTLQVLRVGWSANGGGYPERYLKSLQEKILVRPKMYMGHKFTGSAREKISRDPREWIATVKESYIGKCSETGRPALKVKAEATAYELGRQTFEQVKQDPASVRFSIHARNYVNPKGELFGKKGEVHESCNFLFSTDAVSYDSAGGFAEVANQLGGSDNQYGIYHIYQNNDNPNPNKRGEDMEFKFQFNEAKEALNHETIVTVVRDKVMEDLEVDGLKTKYGDSETTVKELKEQLTAAAEENKKTKMKLESLQAKEDTRNRGAQLKKLCDKHKISVESLGETTRAVCLTFKDDPRPDDYETLSDDDKGKYLTAEQKTERIIVERKKDMAEELKKLNIKDTDVKEDSWLKDVLKDENGKDKETDEQLTERLVA